MVRAAWGRARDAAGRRQGLHALAGRARWRGVFVAEGEAWLQRGAEATLPLPAEGSLAWSERLPARLAPGRPAPAAPRAFWLSAEPAA